MSALIAFLITFVVAVIPLLGVSIALLHGKGSGLIAGYNTASPEEKARYDEKILCRMVGWCVLIITLATALFGVSFLLSLPSAAMYAVSWGYFAIVLGAVIVTQILVRKRAKKR